MFNNYKFSVKFVSKNRCSLVENERALFVRHIKLTQVRIAWFPYMLHKIFLITNVRNMPLNVIYMLMICGYRELCRRLNANFVSAEFAVTQVECIILWKVVSFTQEKFVFFKDFYFYFLHQAHFLPIYWDVKFNFFEGLGHRLVKAVTYTFNYLEN